MNWKKFTLKLFAALLLIGIINLAVSDDSKTPGELRTEVIPYVDNNAYWIKMAELGLATLNPDNIRVEPAHYTGNEIRANYSVTLNSPDVPVTTENSTQSENSIFVNPLDNETLLNSNNSTTNPANTVYGANDFYSFDGGETWDGQLTGAGGANSGDPATAIGTNGRWFVGFISSSLGQGISYSDNQGQTWTQVNVASGGGSTLDKNHLWIDNSPSSPYEGNLYDAWSPLGGSNPNINQIALSYSTDNGESWSTPQGISQAVNAGSHNQGVNIGTGPNGEVYACWILYDSWPSDEDAIGFAKSLDGGVTWESAVRVIDNIRGIRNSGTSKNMRVNSFPSMDVDISTGPGRGNIYITWTNIGEPGINTGPDIDVYMIKSVDEGDTWSDPIRVNQDTPGQGNEHFLPWIACDPETGVLSVIYYDDREVGGSQCEVFCSNSFDEGETWEDMKVSDVSFTPSPIPGLAGGYFGDYLGITARGGMVYPCWTDNRNGYAMTYVSPYQLVVVANPTNLQADVNQENGEVSLTWQLNGGVGFSHFNVYRDDVVIGNPTNTNLTDQLPDYGIYEYKVVAVFQGGLTSDPAYATGQWGNAHISIDLDVLKDTVLVGGSSEKSFKIYNIGEIGMNYSIRLQNTTSASRAYCDASGGCGQYISNVIVGDISNATDCDQYADYTSMSTSMNMGDSYDITVENGNGSVFDKCGVWIDWNQDEEFTADEMVLNVNGAGPYTGSISPPVDALGGNTRMRIRIVNFSALDPCGHEQTGEVEDYSINVIDWIAFNPSSGTVPAGDSTEVQVSVDGNKIAEGQYTFDILVNSNDPDMPQYILPYELLVQPMTVSAYADPAAVCPGGSAQLFANAMGGTGSYTYSWTSDPAGYTADEQNPLFESITTSTIFIVEVDDGENQAIAEASVSVHPLPDIDLGSDVSICEGDSWMFEASGNFSSYLWSTGSTDAMITVSVAGDYWVEVTNEFGCENSDTVTLYIDALPVVDLGEDRVVCEDESLVLDAGNSGASYYWSTGASTQTITIDTSNFDFGTFEIWVEVTNPETCMNSDTIEVEVKNCSFGVDENFAKTTINVFPNPSEGKFTLTIQSPKQQKVNLSILGSGGNKLLSKESVLVDKVYRESIELPVQSAGIYLLMIEKDGKYKMEKIVIR